MAGALDHLEPADARRQRLDDLARGVDRRDGVELADADQRRAVDAGQLVDDVELPHQLHPVRPDLRVVDPASELLRVRHLRTERGEDPGPLRVAHLVAAVVAPRQLGDLVAGEAAEALDKPLKIEPGHRRLQDQPRRMAGMARPVEHRDEAAHRVAVHDRPGDAKDVAERPHVVGADLERPVRRVVPRRATVVAQVEVDDLGTVASAARSRA